MFFTIRIPTCMLSPNCFLLVTDKVYAWRLWIAHSGTSLLYFASWWAQHKNMNRSVLLHLWCLYKHTNLICTHCDCLSAHHFAFCIWQADNQLAKHCSVFLHHFKAMSSLIHDIPSTKCKKCNRHLNMHFQESCGHFIRNVYPKVYGGGAGVSKP